ncbi:MAG: serine--tRNA ligase [Deltaproteobacteria bacterium]|nr:serine--tRNA ligase [Deltaproteobacteria bacterium]
MLDPARMDDVLRRGGGIAEHVEAWRSIDKRRRELQAALDTMRQERNAANERMSKLDKKSAEFTEARDKLKELSGNIKRDEAELAKAEADAELKLLELPNAPHASTPDGTSEADNPVLHVWGEKPTYEFAPKPHWEVGEKLGILDFEAGVRIAGARFTVLRDGASKLTRALINFMLDTHTSHGYTEVWPPAVVRRAALRGTGQLPKFEADLFKLQIPVGPDHDPDHDLFLSPTAEVQVTNLFMDQILEAEALPQYLTAYSACFRAEAGASGKDTRGLIRQHQFDKVELVKLVAPESSAQELEALREDAERILQRLELHYRVVTLCTGDMGFAAAKTYDLEVWLPGQDTFREISSCSNFEAFQARRAKIRYRPAAGDKPRPLHTLNGSGIAVGRTVVAILEQYQQADGSVVIPEVLRPYLGGLERLVPRSQ